MTCPIWLQKRISGAKGSISFYDFMDWSLNDPEYGAYATGRLQIGKKGDFITSPSLGPAFAELLAIQIIDWLKQIDEKSTSNQKLFLIDIGPGEGDLSRDLILSIMRISPEIAKKLNLILVEANYGMEIRQRRKLEAISFIPISWKTLEDLQESPVNGVILAHELLDALPVERIVYRNNSLFRQGVSIIQKNGKERLTFVDLPMSKELNYSIDETCRAIDLSIPPVGVSEGWCSEWHLSLNNWFKTASNILSMGTLLVIDYALESYSYYNSTRSSGTLLAYRNHTSSPDILREPGCWDITSHLCLETLNYFAKKNGFIFLGNVSQGIALLSLGLAQKIYALQSLPSSKLSTALVKRENYLRLVDPKGLGNFSWIAFQVNNNSSSSEIEFLETLFLKEPV